MRNIICFFVFVCFCSCNKVDNSHTEVDTNQEHFSEPENAIENHEKERILAKDYTSRVKRVYKADKQLKESRKLLKSGMTAKEVQGIYLKPSSIEKRDDDLISEIWRYDIDKKAFFELTFGNDRKLLGYGNSGSAELAEELGLVQMNDTKDYISKIKRLYKAHKQLEEFRESLKIGMTTNEAQKIYLKPSSIEKSNDDHISEIWRYDIDKKVFFKLTFGKDGKLVGYKNSGINELEKELDFDK